MLRMLIVIALLACSLTAVAGECTWYTEEVISAGTRCQASNGYFIFQNDGNVVIYDGNGKAMWSTTTDGRGHQLKFQDDGNLVVRGRTSNSLWHSGTHLQGGERLVFQNDRNLVIYNKANRAIWATDTN